MSKLPSDINPDELKKQFDRDYFVWNGTGQVKGYRGTYADFPENLKFLEYIKSLNPESVLEAGCSYGFLIKRLNDAGIPAEGFDVSSFAIKMRVTDKIRQASVLNLSCYKDKQFDLVVSIELLEHIPEAYTEQALKELARVSKRGVHWIAYKEVDDLFQTKDITHINIKPLNWWKQKILEICGTTHIVVHKEIDWYPKQVSIPQGGLKRGLNVGSFVNCLLNTEDTTWLNIDVLDLEAYAKAYGYNFQRMDARRLTFTDNSFDYIVCSHILEHLTLEEGKNFLLDCHRILKPNGIMRLSVPDAELLAKKYISKQLGYFDEINPECEKAGTQIEKVNTLLWSGHKAIYDATSLSDLLEETGFKASVQSFNQSQRPDLMKQVFDYHPDLSIFCEATPIKKEAITGGTSPSSVSGKLKIALISTPFLKSKPDHYGGLETVVADLAAGLAEMGHDVTLFAAKGSKPIGQYKVFETIDPVFSYSTDWSKVNWFEMERLHYETFKHLLKDFDICHDHSWYAFPYLAKRENPVLRVLHTHHGGLSWKTKPCEKMNLIAISKYMADIYARQLNTHVCFVYNGIDLNAYPFKKEKGNRLIYIGRYTSFKQPHIAIEVAKKLNMGLDLCGGAYEEPYFSQYVKPYCDGKQIVLHTELPHEEKVRLLQNAKALLFPSKMGEPFGLVYAEAAACGTPTVALRDGAIPEIVVEGVSGFVRDDAEGMVQAVKQVDLIKPENCRSIVEQNFTKEIMAKKYLELYKEIVYNNNEW